MAKPTLESSSSLLVVELWGVGDVALAVPFLKAASRHSRVTLLAKKHAAPILRRFAPGVDLIAVDAPWTSFSGKYRLHQWPWSDLGQVLRTLRQHHFDAGLSAREDPRDHLLLKLSGVRRRFGFPRAGSGPLLTDRLGAPRSLHRAEFWRRLAGALGWDFCDLNHVIRAPAVEKRGVVIHTGAGHPVRRWPAERFEEIASMLRAAGYEVKLMDDSVRDMDELLDVLSSAGAFIGNDSGPGHLAALLGIPTFTVFGPQLPERFSPRHPHAAWVEGAGCPHKPCFDSCHYARAHCIQDVTVQQVWSRIPAWLDSQRLGTADS